MCRGLFCSGRAGGNSTTAAVIADMVHGGVNYGLVVNIVNDRDVHVIHCGVVVEGPVVPISASIANPTIAEAVVDATVEADLLAPVAFVPSVGVVAPTPVTRSPEQTCFRRLRPRTWHPKVAFISVRPVAGRPQITGSGDHGLFVHR